MIIAFDNGTLPLNGLRLGLFALMLGLPLYRRTLSWAMNKRVAVAMWPNDTIELRWVKLK